MTRTAPSRSLRLRVTLMATLIVTAALALGIAVIAITLVSSVRANVDTTLTSYATSVGRSADGTWPKPLPAVPDDPSAWAQVVDGSGTVVAATANVQGRPARYTLPAGSTTPRTVPGQGTDDDEHVVAQRYVAGTTPVVVYTGASTRILSIVTNDLQGHLLFVLPLVVLGALGMSWVLIGRTLRPVERIRAEAAEITGSDLHRRIPGPTGDDEIGRLTGTLNSMLERLEDSATRQRRFVADASHELRTPLAAVRTSLEVGIAYPDRAPWPDLAERAVTETARLQRLVDSLLLLARADDDTLLTHHEPIDLAALARTAARSVPARIPLEIHTDDGVRVLGDPDQLTRLIRNLLDNADRHAATHVQLTVTTDGPDTAVLQVSDDGPGIPPADRDRIFDRFVRLQAARTRQSGPDSGTGLGLAIARDIATAHRGTLTVTDRPPTTRDTGVGASRDTGVGASFTLRLPIART
ncbi:sensor histidine kinase [Streptomyces violaceusniger]|uniref:histidine kinase n=1 Tax=Streptomyces violaceusniger (strain Tu 4113) TaxID=653045 RepID=G2NSU7_STRV4|nr:HAMP domain-containing sensor histidine kinase [Streptomyces violaceusniger]AEM81136.1 integral membrane sensor signal transduction histidine kinase [Streptomyces violaceusniger Tu 4113]